MSDNKSEAKDRPKEFVKDKKTYNPERKSYNKKNFGQSDDQDRRRLYLRRKTCRFCADKSLKLDYKQYEIIRRFVTIGGKIIPRRISGNCAKHQRTLASAIKRARFIAFLPYVRK